MPRTVIGSYTLVVIATDCKGRYESITTIRSQQRNQCLKVLLKVGGDQLFFSIWITWN